VASLVLAQGLPLLWEQGDAHHPGLSQAFPAVAAVAFQDTALVVAGNLNRDHRDLLQLALYQAAAHLGKTRVLEQLGQAYRDLELSQAQLVQSSKLAAIGQLAAGVAHELNTPLGSVVLNVDMARVKLSRRPDELPASLDAIKKAALTCRQIISKLLLYARGSEGSGQQADLNQVVGGALDLLGPQFALQGVSIRTFLEADLEPVQGPPGELQQVVVNLLLNGRDSGATELRIVTERGVLRVEDDGAGMTPEALARACDPFFTTKPVGQGTGLGLTVSQQIVSACGGSLEIRSEVGRGTVCSLRLKPATRV
jgi:two-component system NtrC family sensor kinase